MFTSEKSQRFGLSGMHRVRPDFTLNEQGVPEDLQWLLRELFTVVFDGRNCNVMSGVEEALGRPATDFKVYLRKTIESGVWNPVIQKESA